MDGTSLSLVWPAAGVAVVWFAAQRSAGTVRLDLALLSVTTFVLNAVTGPPRRSPSRLRRGERAAGPRVRCPLRALVPAGVGCGRAGTADRCRPAHAAAGRGGGGHGGRRPARPDRRLGAQRHVVLGDDAGVDDPQHREHPAARLGGLPRGLPAERPARAERGGGRPRGRGGARAPPARLAARRTPRPAGLRGRAYALVFVVYDGLPVAFPLIALAVWAALRFDTTVVLVLDVALGVAAVVLTLTGHGPFALIADDATRANRRPALREHARRGGPGPGDEPGRARRPARLDGALDGRQRAAGRRGRGPAGRGRGARRADRRVLESVDVGSSSPTSGAG